jgi:LPS export ABC transporter protein LptC
MRIKLLLSLLLIFSFFSCTFDYGDKDAEDDALPDLIMENVEYVRVRSADPFARIQADRFERYEKQKLAKLENVVFEQYGDRGEEINVYGKAGSAVVNIESGDIFMDKNVNLEVRTEDITLETYQLEWKDEFRSIFPGEKNETFLYRENGTRFTGIGLQANARLRSWEFLGSINGVYVHEDDDEEEN